MNKFSVIIECIKKKYPTLNFEIEINKMMEITLNFGKFTLTLIDGLTFKDAVRYIEKFRKERTNFECNICLQQNYAICPCNKCANDICMSCTADIIEKNEGLMICPYCKTETGYRMPFFQMIQVRDNFRMMNYDINKKMTKSCKV